MDGRENRAIEKGRAEQSRNGRRMAILYLLQVLILTVLILTAAESIGIVIIAEM